MDLREELKGTLDSVFFDLGIHSHWKHRRDDVGDEYVLYCIISTPYTEFANNKPIMQEQNVDINYYALNGTFNNSHIELVKSVMYQNGWTLVNGETDIPFTEKTIEDGINMEFSREVTV